MHRSLAASAAAVLLAACAATNTTPAPDLTAAAIRNATYSCCSGFPNQRKIALVDGEYDAFPAEHLRVVLLDSLAAYGDLDGDGDNDAATFLAVNTGGTGVFVELVAIRNDRGKPVHAASFPLGDRVAPESVTIADTVVTAVVLAHADDDPACCPTLRVTRRFSLIGATSPKTAE